MAILYLYLDILGELQAPVVSLKHLSVDSDKNTHPLKPLALIGHHLFSYRSEITFWYLLAVIEIVIVYLLFSSNLKQSFFSFSRFATYSVRQYSYLMNLYISPASELR